MGPNTQMRFAWLINCTGGVGEAQLQVKCKSVVRNFVILQQQLVQSYLTDIANAVTLCNHAHGEMVISLVLLRVLSAIAIRL